MLRKDETRKVDTDLVASGLRKLFLLKHSMLEFLMEREEPIHTSVLALMTGNHHFTLGPPGTSKSQLPWAIAMAFKEFHEDPEFYFYKLMSRTMEPDELFGPLSLEGVEQGDYRREIDGFIPKAKIFFGDELYKTGDAVLNNLLGVMNERLFRNGKETLKVPLFSMFGASNELYEGSSLDALHKRIAFKHQVGYIEEVDNFYKMLDYAVDGVGEPQTADIGFTSEELAAIQQYLYNVEFPAQAKATMWEMRVGFNDAALVGAMDDRLAFWLVSISRAEALLARVEDQLNDAVAEVLPTDETELAEIDVAATVREVVPDVELDLEDISVEPQHFAVTQHCFWDVPKNIVPIRTVVLNVASPVAEEAVRFIDSAQHCRDASDTAMKNPSLVDTEKQQAALEANSEVAEIVEQLEKRIKETDGNSRRHFQKALDKVATIHKVILEDHLGVNL